MLQFEGSMSPAKCLTTPAEGDLQLIRKVVAAGYLLALPLLYAYTAESMGPEFLKGRDAFLFNAFHHAGVNVEVKFVLCVDKTRVYTPNYGPDYDDFPESEWFPCFDRAILVNPEMVQKSLQLKKNLAEKEETLRQESVEREATWRATLQTQASGASFALKRSKLFQSYQKRSLHHRRDTRPWLGFLWTERMVMTIACGSCGMLSPNITHVGSEIWRLQKSSTTWALLCLWAIHK